MWSSFTNPILPIFAILAIGYGMHRLKIFDVVAAQSINKFVFFVATPALIFSIVSKASISEFDSGALAIYFVGEMCIYLGTFLFLHFKLGFDRKEALLLGMTSVFVNHVFFVLPIAERVYGATAVQPIAGIVLVDVVILFCGTVLAMDLMQTRKASPLKVASLLVRNPFLIASLLGMMTWGFQSLIPGGLYTYAEFAGAAAAPASLFALGVILANNPLRPIGVAGWSVVAIKIVVHPLIVFTLAGIFAISPEWDHITLLVAAGPCGAMPFVIALQYGIRTELIAKVILISTILSLLTLSVLTV